MANDLFRVFAYRYLDIQLWDKGNTTTACSLYVLFRFSFDSGVNVWTKMLG